MTLHKHAVFCTIRQKTDVELWLLNGFAPNKLPAIRGRLICFKNTLIDYFPKKYCESNKK